MRKYLIAGALIGLITFLALGMAIAAVPSRQVSQTTDQFLLTHVAGLETRVTSLERVPPIPASATQSPTATRTPSNTPTLASTAQNPTQEILTASFTATNTSFPHTNTPTRTRTATPIPTIAGATLLPTSTPLAWLEWDYRCPMLTTTNLTLRTAPSTFATSAGVLPAGSTITIYPNQSSVFVYSLATTPPAAYDWWYVRVGDNDADPYNDLYAVFAKVVTADQTPPNTTPRILEYFMNPVDQPCTPTLLR